MACIKLYEALGARHENFLLFDKKGVLHKGRTDMEEFKLKYANAKGEMTLAQAMKDAVASGRNSYLAKRIPKKDYAQASTTDEGKIKLYQMKM